MTNVSSKTFRLGFLKYILFILVVKRTPEEINPYKVTSVTTERLLKRLFLKTDGDDCEWF